MDDSPLLESHPLALTTQHSALSYEEALAFWYSRINYEQMQPAPTDLKLDRMRALLGLLGNPHQRLRIIHVAGSKGKGSTSAMLAAILQRAGYCTGLFTSPHLERVEERIQVNGQPISAPELTAHLSQIRECVNEAPRTAAPAILEGLTFFEIATAVGFLHFVQRRVEAAVIEVGLGGRFDSTNVCQPVLSIITSISFDHTRLLGNRLASIAREKAGIIKPGRPVISGVAAAEARSVIEETCRQRGAPIRQLGVDFHYDYTPAFVTSDQSDAKLASVRVTTGKRRWPSMRLRLLGEHQAANATGVVAAIEELRSEGWHISDEAVQSGLAEVRWPARMEVLAHQPLVILDCAHNVASAEALVNTLGSSFSPGKRFLIFAGSGDKDIPGMFRTLAPHFDRIFLTRYHNNPRAVPTNDLAAWLKPYSEIPPSLCPDSKEAWIAARNLAGGGDLICITGSVFLAGEMRPWLIKEL
ncbi:MAG: bifunctional folylpolyglutamate synthase/dihydrofolate synthase [Gemmataceae bacterium]